MTSENTNVLHTTALGMCQMMLKPRMAAGGSVKMSDIMEVVSELGRMPTFATLDKNRLTAELQQRFTVRTGMHQTLGLDQDHVPWLPKRRGAIRWDYWDRYRIHLTERMSESAVDSIDRITDDILARIEDPQRTGLWDSRGLVMGHVQSGKTANYTGLLCKAADAGYKVLIILAGVHNSLRSQTQIRIDEGFLGFMSDASGQQTFKRAGVGLINSSILANTGTNRTQLGDFNEAVAKKWGIHPGGLPLVFVVKKNVSVLENLIGWISSCADADEASGRRFVRDVPALIVDDEADLASVDTRNQVFDEDGQPDLDHDPARTNADIRLLLRSFEKVAYVGYTATPFANIYIHEKAATRELGPDLFPRNYIVNIPAPSNYMGPARIFGIREDEDAGLEAVPALPIFRKVDDHAASKKVDETAGWMPPKLVAKTEHVPLWGGRQTVPPSLREAIMAFILANAVRRLREQGPLLNTMLVHVVRYKSVQKKVAEQVEMALREIHLRLRNGDGERTPGILYEFRKLWDGDFARTTRSCAGTLELPLALPDWKAVQPTLETVASSIRIKIINGSAGDVLDYDEHRETGMDVIAIGGDKLSRGLTLDGLSVSYFLRSSKMYDTLMQMGRWFGYRERYVDVCRLYTTTELRNWFTHIAAASEELQQEFRYMCNVGGTPKDYGLKVRSHPVMLVTSAVKMRHGTEMRLSFSGDISETTKFHADPDWLRANSDFTGSWLGSLGEATPGSDGYKGYSWQTSAEAVLAFLAGYKTHEEVRRADTALLSRYIRTQRDRGELLDWTVYLISSGTGSAGRVGALDLGLTRRAPHTERSTPGGYTIRRIVDPADECFDLSKAARDSALALTIANWKASDDPRKKKTEPTRPNGREARQFRDKRNGLLLLYPLDPDKAGLPEGTPPVIGMGVSFPKSDTAKEITYTVNNVFTALGGDDDSF